MTTHLKKTLWTSGWLLSLLAAFGAGAWYATYYLPGPGTPSIFTHELVSAIDTQRYLSYMDTGKQKELKESLVLQLDNQIMLLSSLIDYANTEEDRESARKFLRRVAQHRQKYPVTYREVPTNVAGAAEANAEISKVHTYVDEILKSYDPDDGGS